MHLSFIVNYNVIKDAIILGCAENIQQFKLNEKNNLQNE
ncbi:predicted protein [Botrytis cinerea T4]|uniref:Uncharacterized protein n=1 Tax=Botryotinia fuckeliana (strain T4) TaxID=999810 RepID=G2Y089_BOTF4|nr:predicted protein [Botrytis cinerea T4]